MWFGESDCLYEFMDVYTLILESLDEGGGSYGRFRRVGWWPAENFRLATHLLKMVKVGYYSFGFNDSNPVTLKSCSLNLATKF